MPKISIYDVERKRKKKLLRQCVLCKNGQSSMPAGSSARHKVLFLVPCPRFSRLCFRGREWRKNIYAISVMKKNTHTFKNEHVLVFSRVVIVPPLGNCFVYLYP